MGEAHPLTTIIANRAKALASVPEAVSVLEYRRDQSYLQVHIYPGSVDNAGAIIGKGGYNIEEIRRYVEALALELGVTVKIRVITDERQPTESRR